MPPSNDPPASIIWAALRADVPEEAGREPPEEFEVLPVVAGAEVLVTDDFVFAEEVFPDAVLVEAEVFEVAVLICLSEETETVLLVELDVAVLTTRLSSQSRPETAGAAVANRAKPRTAAIRNAEHFIFEGTVLGQQRIKTSRKRRRKWNDCKGKYEAVEKLSSLRRSCHIFVCPSQINNLKPKSRRLCWSSSHSSTNSSEINEDFYKRNKDSECRYKFDLETTHSNAKVVPNG